MQGLGAVTGQRPPARAHQGRQGGDHGLVVEQGDGQPGHVADRGVLTRARPRGRSHRGPWASRRPAPGAGRGGELAQQLDRLGGRSPQAHLGLEHAAARRPAAAAPVRQQGQRLLQAVAEGAELEEVEQAAQLVQSLGPGAARPARTLDGHVAHAGTMSSTCWRTDASSSARFWRSFGVWLSRLAKMPSRPLVGVDQLGRRLLAHPGHAGQVVRRVTPQGGVVQVAQRVTPVRSSMPASS